MFSLSFLHYRRSFFSLRKERKPAATRGSTVAQLAFSSKGKIQSRVWLPREDYLFKGGSVEMEKEPAQRKNKALFHRLSLRFFLWGEEEETR